MSSLIEVLSEAQDLGFFGPGPVEAAVEHARGFAAELDPPERFVDLGTGGGLPGLVLAGLWPRAHAVLLDANERRCAFLQGALGALGLEGRVRVVQERAEVAGRQPGLRHQNDLVVSRSFGPPPVTAECAAPLLRVGGHLVVSEPPDAESTQGERWPVDPLAELGLAVERGRADGYHYRVLIQVELCPERYPRRVGIPGKRPLY